MRSTLIASGRGLASREGHISIRKLCAETGISRETFDQIFASKEALISAIVERDVETLSAIAAINAPETDMRAGGEIVMMAPPADQWLERRLRVFEKSLAGLEARQDKFEREVRLKLAQLEERIAGLPPQEEQPAVAAEETAQEEISYFPEFEMDHPGPAPVDDLAPEIVPAPEEPVPEEPAPEEPAQETQIGDFIARARVAARDAEPAPAGAANALPRWIAWMGVVAVTLTVCAFLALSNARATQVAPASAGIYRDLPHDALGRLMALANSGDQRAQTLLALAYLKGTFGVATDPAAARRWSMAAAEQGEPVAQYLVGALSDKDDAAKAFAWYEQAALRGNLKAMHNVAIAYAEGRGTPQDDRRAAAWFNRAAQQGYVDSQFDLAVLFERGQGVTQNRIAALKWYLIAAKAGDAVSRSRADELSSDMPEAEQAEAAAKAESYKPQAQTVAANVVSAP